MQLCAHGNTKKKPVACLECLFLRQCEPAYLYVVLQRQHTRETICQRAEGLHAEKSKQREGDTETFALRCALRVLTRCFEAPPTGTAP